MKNKEHRHDATVRTMVQFRGNRPTPAPAYSTGQLVEWYEEDLLFRGIITEVVRSGGRPQTPGLEVSRFTDQPTYVIQGGRVLSSGTVKTVKLLWPRCVKFTLVNEEQMSCT